MHNCIIMHNYALISLQINCKYLILSVYLNQLYQLDFHYFLWIYAKILTPSLHFNTFIPVISSAVPIVLAVVPKQLNTKLNTSYQSVTTTVISEHYLDSLPYNINAETLLYGDDNLSSLDNQTICQAVHKFIIATKRFNN